jgi:hypothetical protein
LPTENEILVNEILHEKDGSIADSLISSNGDEMIKVIGEYFCHFKYFRIYYSNKQQQKPLVPN